MSAKMCIAYAAAFAAYAAFFCWLAVETGWPVLVLVSIFSAANCAAAIRRAREAKQ